MHNTLIYNKLWHDICDGDIAPTKPTNATSLAKWNLKVEKTLALFCSSVTKQMFVHIENSKDAWSAWNLLKKLFDTLVASQRVDLQMKLLKQRLADNGDVLEYISRIKNTHLEIIKGGFSKLEDSFLVSIVINGLPPYYKHFLENLQIIDKLSTITFDSLSELLAQHSKTFGKQKQSREDFLYTKAESSKERGKSNSQNFHNQSSNRGHGKDRGQGRGHNNFHQQNFQSNVQSGRGWNFSQVRCKRCLKMGHYASNCLTSNNQLPKFKQTSNANSQQSAQYVEDQDYQDDEYEYVFSAIQHVHSFENDWILDTGATQHMNYCRDYFWNYKYVQLNPIYLADDTTHIPQGRGSVKFFLLGNGEKWISNVWYVPSFKKHLLSLVTIRQDGHQIVMQDGLVNIMSVKDNLKKIMTGYEDGKLLRMNGKVIKRKEEVAATTNSKMSSFRLWHFRYGHLNFESLLKLKSQDLVKGLPTFNKENSKGEACILGKQKREAFPTSSWRATKYLELIHSDICGPMESSFGGCRYFILFIDDHTRMTWAYFLKEKSEPFEKFVNFQHMVENKTREKVASLRTDNGGEFTSTEFNDYCRNNGIKRQLTNSYTP
jgi:hypothetical protein